jgi:hypothetical protein
MVGLLFAITTSLEPGIYPLQLECHQSV